MKGLKISFALFCMVLVINIYFYCFVRSTTQEILTVGENISSAVEYEDCGKAADNLTKLVYLTEKYTPLWQIVINHDETDDVYSSMEKLEGCFDSGAYDEGIIYLKELMYFIDNLYEREKITFYNLF